MQGIDLLLLPGLMTDARVWQPLISELSGEAEITVADLTGADSMAGLAASALRQAPAERFALAGFSMGGYVALEIMRQAPDRVLALALVDTSARPDTPEMTRIRRTLMQLAETDLVGVIDTLMPRLVHPSRADDPGIAETMRKMAQSVGKEAFFRQQAAIIGRIDSRPFLGGITCPTLVLCGREDQITPLEAHEEMAAQVAGARLVVLGECGHMSLLEQPRQVAEAFRNWLVDVSG